MRTIAYWEKKRREAEKELREVHRALQARPPKSAPRRRYVLGDTPIRVVRYAQQLAYLQWKQNNAKRRKLFRERDKLHRRVAYYDQRIAALKIDRTAWRRVLQGPAI